MDFKNFYRRNWFAIIYFNFKMLPFKQAIKLPFDFYYKVRFVELTGKVILKNNVQRGAIQIGRAGSDFLAKTESVISIKGNLIFNGPIFIGNGVTLEVNEGATVEFGKSVRITARTKIISQEQITIKDNVGISWESQIIDSNFHYIRNTKTGVIHKKSVPVVIGANCWIGNRVSIGKGTILPDYSIVASNSLLTKSYSDFPEHSVFAGIPAKMIATDQERIIESLEPDLITELNQKFNSLV
jgi:acetyltransferase-like isoleucine patch superfamily enzyme